MVLTGGSYVGLGEAGARAGRVAKDNPYHDARGWFTTAEGAGGAANNESNNHIHENDGKIPDEPRRGADAESSGAGMTPFDLDANLFEPD
jgi:hypothetical protein